MSDAAGGSGTGDGHDITCPNCGAPLGAHFEERGGLVYMRGGGMSIERARCWACWKTIWFTPSNEELPEFIARLLERRAKREGQE